MTEAGFTGFERGVLGSTAENLSSLDYQIQKDIYTAYCKAGYSRKYYDARESDITIHKAAKKAFDDLALKSCPPLRACKRSIPICSCRRSSIMQSFPRLVTKRSGSRFIRPTPRCSCARMPTTSGRQESINRKNSTATQGAAEREPFDQSGGWGRVSPTSSREISGDGNLPCSSSLYKRRHCLPSVTSQTRLLLFNKCLWLYKQKIKSHHSSAKSATSLTSLTARASWSLFSSPVFCSMFATWNLTVDISQPISAAMRV